MDKPEFVPMDAELALKLLEECHRHIHNLEVLGATSDRASFATMCARIEARKRADRLMGAILMQPTVIEIGPDPGLRINIKAMEDLLNG